MDILPFAVADRPGGIPLENVRHVVRATEILPLPRAPRIIAGVIDFHGDVVPVVNLRDRLRLAQRHIELTDRFIISDAGGLLIALHVDSVGTVSVVEAKPFGTEAEDSLTEGLGITGAASLPDGMVLIYDLKSFFTASEREALEAALAEPM